MEEIMGGKKSNQLHFNIDVPGLIKENETEKCTMPSAVRSAFTDEQIRDMADHWFDHYRNVGDSHHEDTPDFRIIEVYWDKVLDRMLDDLRIELTDKQIDGFCDWFSDFY